MALSRRLLASGACASRATISQLTGSGSGGSSSLRRRHLATLRVAGVPEHFNAPFHLASKRGLYEEQGVNFEWAMTPGGTGAMAQALESDEVDLAVMLSEGAVARAAAGAPLKVVGTYVQSPLRWGIHVMKGSPLRHIPDLKGKTFGVSRMLSGSHLMAHVLAHQQGWDIPADAPLKVVNSLDGARKAMEAGEIDVWLWEKFTTKHLVDQGEWSIIGEVPTPWPCFCFAASERALAEKGDEIRKVVEATKKVSEEFKSNSEGSTTAYVSEHHQLDVQDASEWLSGTEWACDLQVDEATLQKTQEALVVIGQLEKPVNYEDLIDSAICRLTSNSRP
jgi:ABC-type nitrate/sulfonate/bicarbonate transport system substrate-binding protein